MNVSNHNGILFRRWAFSHKCTIGHSQRAFSGAVICCPVRHHSWSSPSQLMELQRPANGRQWARSSLCGQNGFRYPFSLESLRNEQKTSKILQKQKLLLFLLLFIYFLIIIMLWLTGYSILNSNRRSSINVF